MNKFVQPRPYANPEAAARELLELANAVEPVQDGRIHIELINGPMLFEKATPAEYKAGLKLCIERGWLAPHESGHLREVHRGGRRPVRITIGTAFLSSRYLHGLWRGLICPPCTRAIHLGWPIAERAIDGGPVRRNELTVSPMTTDHQVTEHQPTNTESGLGMIVTALIVLATFATVVLLVAR